jgi:myo-inositol-1(or 4)-monophosphatase
VASGKLHGYLAAHLEPWDMAPGIVLIREAGGKVTDINGKKWELGDKSILAANPKLHKKLLELIHS